VAGCCEHGNERSGSIKGRECLCQLSDCQLLQGGLRCQNHRGYTTSNYGLIVNYKLGMMRKEIVVFLFKIPFHNLNGTISIKITGIQTQNRTRHLFREQSFHWKFDSRSAVQEVLCVLWNPKVHYRVNKNQPLGPILSPMHWVHILTECFSYHLPTDLPSGLFMSLDQNFLHTHLPHASYMTHPFNDPNDSPN
jgi:hypothetical protein